MSVQGTFCSSASTCTSTHTHTHMCGRRELLFKSAGQVKNENKLKFIPNLVKQVQRKCFCFFLHLHCVCIIVCMYCSICVPYLTHITLGRKHKAPPTLVHCTVAEEHCFHLEKNAVTEACFCLTCRHDGGTVVRLYLCGCGCGPCR